MRYLLLALWGTGWAWRGFHGSHDVAHLTDWDVLRFGGLVVANDEPAFHAPALHLYDRYPRIQVGPVALFVDGVLQRAFAGFHYGGDIAVMAVIIGLSLVCVRVLETVSPRRPVVWLPAVILVAGWSMSLSGWGHLEDALAVTGIMLAAAAVHRGTWWQAALAVGLAMSCKPWAVIAVPLLLAFPRRQAARGAVVAVVIAVGPWLPFLIADPHTTNAFQTHWLVTSDSSLRALGFHVRTWTPSGFREVQLGLAVVAAAVVVRRCWASAPLAAMAVKVLLDPAAFPYYGIGPVAAAALLDAHQGRRWPVWTIVTAAVEYGTLWTPTLGAYARLGWALATVLILLRNAVRTRPDSAPIPVYAGTQAMLS